MSTVKKSHAVYGYIRNNYEHNIPDVIIKMCLMYFDVVFQYRYKNQIFQQLLSFPVCRAKFRLVIFNKDLAFGIGIAPNGIDTKPNQSAPLLLEVKHIANSIDSITICFQFDVPEIQSSMIALTRFDAEKQDFYYLPMNPSKIHQQKQLTIKFIIHSLIIKYKKDKETLYYPSLGSIKLKEKIRFEWNVDKTTIESFRNYTNGFGFSSPIFDNVSIRCYPNGADSDSKGRFCWGLFFGSFPLDIKKITVKIIAKTNVCEKRREYVDSLSSEDSIIWCNENEFAHNELKDELVFEMEAIILELYDFSDDLIPKQRWFEHNVCI